MILKYPEYTTEKHPIVEAMAMDANVTRWQITGFLFTSILGTLLHFLFDFSGQSMAAALFSAVNESIWEHLKLLFYPMLVFALLEHRWLKDPAPVFWCVKLKGILLGLMLIPVIYYTYTGILGIRVDWVNIAIFFLAAALSFFLETKLFQEEWNCRLNQKTVFFFLWLIGVIFTIFTFRTPQIPFFRDPVTGTYGFMRQ
jgi:hypothetical protein